MPTMSTDLSVVAKTLDRYGISDRAGAAIVSATLQEVGLISEGNLANVVDRSKVRRARERERTLLANTSSVTEKEEFGLYFDGRKDKTLTVKDSRRKVIMEEHISVVKEPASEYMGHLSLQSGKAIEITKRIYDFLTYKRVDLSKFMVIGCDGTAVNTGRKGGVLRCLECKLGRPLQWCVCQLHANELNLRHLFEYLDGTTSGPRSFTGTIGKMLNGCEELPIVTFAKIECSLPQISNKEDLSTDQMYLLEMCEAINVGVCSERLSKRNPGKMVHSRWLTAGNRILRLYVSTAEPNEALTILTTFIVKVYAPMWFAIKTKPLCIYGAKHLHQTIVLSRYLPDYLKAIIYPVIQRNGFFGHPENILICMIADDTECIQKLALRRILKARQDRNVLKTVRSFVVPPFNFEADNYVDMINWNETTVTDPPLTKSIDTDTISQCIINPTLIKDFILSKIRHFPCHTQATERCVKIVTEASAAVCGPERRDGFIRTRLESRKIVPVFETKKQFRLL